MSAKRLVYAIDFGTSNSLLAAADGTKIFAPIPLDSKAKDPSVLRSVLFFPNQNKVFYGAEAVQHFSESQGEGRLIRSIKKQLPIRSFVGTYVGDRPLNLEDLIGLFLGELRKRANAHFGQQVDAVVLGRPARFAVEDADDRFAQFRLEDSAKRAGFKEIHFCPEPIAAAHEFREQLREEKIVCVADFGGGTSDFTLVRIGPAEYRPSDVLSLGGVSVAGDALDGAIMRNDLSRFFGADVEYRIPFGSNVLRMPIHLMERLCSAADINYLEQREVREFLNNVKQWAIKPEDRLKLERLMRMVEEQLGFYVFENIEGAKRSLSENDTAKINLSHPAIEIEEMISRGNFDKFTHVQVDSITGCLDETLKKAGLTPAQVDIVCCTGGTARVPVIQTELISRFGASKVIQHNYFHSVVEGLARVAQRVGN